MSTPAYNIVLFILSVSLYAALNAQACYAGLILIDC